MYRKIITSKELSLKQRLKKIITYYYSQRRAKISWDERFKKVFAINPCYKMPINKTEEKVHSNYWSCFSGKVNMNTIRVCFHISSVSSAEIVPEEIFVSDIEPTLNKCKSIDYISNKSFYELWFTDSRFPKCFIHNIDGEIYDDKLNSISSPDINDIAKMLDYPVVLKPNRDSYGGKDVFFIKNIEELIDITKDRKDFVVQEKIKQHPFFSKFHSTGLNTIRVYLYRSVSNNKIIVLNAALRMGKGGSLDNETAGGIVCFIKNNGQLNGFAVDKYGCKFETHPDTKLGFSELVPYYDDLISESIKIGQKLFFGRLIGLDAALDFNSRWRFIEINPFGHTIRFAQYAGQPFFGDCTKEVRDFCKKNHWSLNNGFKM